MRYRRWQSRVAEPTSSGCAGAAGPPDFVSITTKSESCDSTAPTTVQQHDDAVQEENNVEKKTPEAQTTREARRPGPRATTSGSRGGSLSVDRAPTQRRRRLYASSTLEFFHDGSWTRLSTSYIPSQTSSIILPSTNGRRIMSGLGLFFVRRLLCAAAGRRGAGFLRQEAINATRRSDCRKAPGLLIRACCRGGS